MCQIKFLLLLLTTIVVVFVDNVQSRSWPYASAQLIEPEWNWEEVILSRNGPSTTTPPTTTTEYTTLRNVIGVNNKPIKGIGNAIVEAHPLVPGHKRGKASPLNVSPNSGNRNKFQLSTGLLASCVMLLMIVINPIHIQN